jgi:hypothetical protein
MKNYKRVFTFGCSFTQYWWPTWANIIATDLGIPSQNWGIGGIGNVAIQHRMVECDLKNTFTEDDLILVLWSTWAREDRYSNTGWRVGGSIFNNSFYDKDFIDKYWSEENDIVRNTTAIISANKMFNIQYQSHWVDYQNSLDDYGRVEPSQLSEFRHLIDALPQKNIGEHSRTEGDDWTTLVDDGHPNVLQHLKFAEQFSNGMGTKLKTSTIDLYKDAHYHVTSILQDSQKVQSNKDIHRHKQDIHRYFKEYFSAQIPSREFNEKEL